MSFWQPVLTAPCLWSVRSPPWSVWFPVMCFSLHFLSWALLCSGMLVSDYPELLGVKQVRWREEKRRGITVANCS